MDNTIFANNIFYIAGAAQFSYAVSRRPDGAYITAPGSGQSTHSEFDSNVYFGIVTPPEDAHALTLDPKFVAVGQGQIGRETFNGYGLQPGSPAIGGAMKIPSPGNNDFNGMTLLPAGPRERGAIQFRQK